MYFLHVFVYEYCHILFSIAIFPQYENIYFCIPCSFFSSIKSHWAVRRNLTDRGHFLSYNEIQRSRDSEIAALSYMCVIHFNLSWSTCVALLPYGVNGAYLLMKGTAGCQAICFSIKLSWVINCKHTRNIWRVDVWEIQPRRVWARNIRT